MRSNNLPAEADLLKRVTVRLIELHEREEFDRRLEADHYLGRCALYGPSVRYVAELDGQYVALYLKARDRWFGWSPRQRARRLGLVANNSRFLVLPEREKLPNLASRVLDLVLRQLNDDWLKLNGKPILVVSRVRVSSAPSGFTGIENADPSPGPQSHELNRDRWAGRFGSIRLYPGDDSFAELLKETFLQEAPSTTER